MSAILNRYGREAWKVSPSEFHHLMCSKNLLGKHREGWHTLHNTKGNLRTDGKLNEIGAINNLCALSNSGHITRTEFDRLRKRALIALRKTVTVRYLGDLKDDKDRELCLKWREVWHKLQIDEFKKEAHRLYKQEILDEYQLEQKEAMDKTFTKVTTRDGAQMPDEVQQLIEGFVGGPAMPAKTAYSQSSPAFGQEDEIEDL